MTICQRCSDIIREAHEGPTRGITSEPGHALQILAKDVAEWKERATAAEARVGELERSLAVKIRQYDEMMETHAGECLGCVEWENTRGKYHGADCEYR